MQIFCKGCQSILDYKLEFKIRILKRLGLTMPDVLDTLDRTDRRIAFERCGECCPEAQSYNGALEKIKIKHCV